jgi:hypothetical protein
MLEYLTVRNVEHEALAFGHNSTYIDKSPTICRKADRACITTPSSIAPAKYFGATTAIGTTHVRYWYKAVNTSKFRSVPIMSRWVSKILSSRDLKFSISKPSPYRMQSIPHTLVVEPENNENLLRIEDVQIERHKLAAYASRYNRSCKGICNYYKEKLRFDGEQNHRKRNQVDSIVQHRYKQSK